jgi:medium-chain acyl-[acyl-carrier-protein] hydrolase
VYRGWQSELPDEVELWSIQLPGRENRIVEPAFTRMRPLVEALAESIAPRSDLPFALFGHSLGAVICFELCRLLRRIGARAPLYLFVSGRRAPQIPDRGPAIHQLPDPELMLELRRLNGTPDWILNDAELMSLVLPSVRADFAVAETYTYTAELPLECSISVFGGAEDPEVSREELAAWEQQTRAKFTLRILPGNHFFLLQRGRSELLRAIGRDLGGIATGVEYAPASTSALDNAGGVPPTAVDSRLLERER